MIRRRESIDLVFVDRLVAFFLIDHIAGKDRLVGRIVQHRLFALLRRLGVGIAGLDVVVRGLVGVVQIELAVDLVQIANLGQGRQFVEGLQIEVIEKLARGAVQRRLARHIALTDHANPVALHQGLDDVRADRHATDVFDLAAGDRLAVGDQRQRFHQRARVTRGALAPQARDPGRDIRNHLDTPAAGHLGDLDATPLVIVGQLAEHFAQGFFVRQFILFKQRQHRVQRQRAAGRQQGGFDNIFQVLRCGHLSLSPLRGSVRRNRPAPAQSVAA